MSMTMLRERRCELLALAKSAEIVDLAERCIAAAPVKVLAGPEVGMVMLQVREPVVRERFYLGEVLVTRAEVERSGTRGWAMRMGDDRVATLAAAICDAEVERGGDLAGEILDLCDRIAERAAHQRADEWSEIAPTRVRFEGLE